jgi:hypothetical protein
MQSPPVETMSRHARLRHATQADFHLIKAFFDAHLDPNNIRRGDKELMESVESRDFFILLDDHDVIKGVTGTFDFCDGDFIELGATLLIDFKGYGLHKHLTYARTIHRSIVDRGAYKELFTTVLPDNSKSIKTQHRTGFVEWAEPPANLHKIKTEMRKAKGRPEHVTYFRLPPERLSDHATELLRKADDPTFTNPHDDKVPPLTLEFLIEPITYYRRVVEAIATGKIPPD